MATQTYRAYFGSVTVTAAKRTSGPANRWAPSNGNDPHSCIMEAIDKITHIDTDYNSTNAMYYSIWNYGQDLLRAFFWYGDLSISVKFRNSAGTTVTLTFDIVYSHGTPTVEDMGGMMDDWIDDLIGLGTIQYYYLDRISFYSPTVCLTNDGGKFLYSNGTSILTGAMSTSSLSFDYNGQLCVININLTDPVGQIIEYTTGTATFVCRNTSNTEIKFPSTLSYYIYPTFLDNYMDTIFNLGYRGSVPYTEQANHQNWLTSSGIEVLQSLRNSFTQDGTAYTSQSSFSFEIIRSFKINGTTYSNLTYTYNMRMSGYNIFLNTAQTQDISAEAYNTFNGTSMLSTNIYPKSVSGTKTQNFTWVFYDEDEGVNSYTSTATGPTWFHRYAIPPTDLIIASQDDEDNWSMHKKTIGTYRFTPNVDGYGITIYDPSDGEHHITNTFPSCLRPGFSTSFTMPNQSIPAFTKGWVSYSLENRVETLGRYYYTSVRYHLTGNIKCNYSYFSGGHMAFILVGVKKNTQDFINNITNWNTPYSQWADVINGITYTKPIAYANKLITFDDLLDKMTMFHGKAIYQWNASYNTFTTVKNYLNTQLWTNMFSGSTSPNKYYGGFDETKYQVRVRYIIVGPIYYYENNWPMRWMSYPTWTSKSQTYFTYRSGLVFKKTPYLSEYSGDLVIATWISQSDWDNAITTNKTYTGGATHYFVYYNGLQGTATSMSYYPNNIGNSNYATWNRDRRGIGNYENRFFSWYDSGTYNFAIADKIYTWLSGTTSYFGSKTNSTKQRWISYTGTTQMSDAIAGLIETSSGIGLYKKYGTDRQHRQATNDILFTQQKTSAT